MISPIVVHRQGALGDVVLTTPIIRALHRENPNAHLYVSTGQPSVFIGHPYARVGNGAHFPQARHIDLNLAYEERPRCHIVDAYAEKAGLILADADKQQEMHWQNTPIRERWISRVIPERAVLLHPAKSWANRTFPPHFWGEVGEKLARGGYSPVIIGTGSDDILPHAGRSFVDLRCQLTTMEIAYVAATRAAAFVGSDSGLLHVVGTTDCPIIGIFTCARAEYRLPYRHGRLGWRCAAVTPELDCYGCLADEPPPVTACGCRRGDLACIADVAPQAVMARVIQLLETEVQQVP